ncbi:winged helix-turn-helix domain-containing protein [Erythrobacter longus]|uniref:winged helix-turn-helix domain-containing protein n=1 Tax=Erythrobacter longus TaxID=1044 RepID=UPI0026A9E451
MIRYENKVRLRPAACCPHCGGDLTGCENLSYGNIVLEDIDKIFFEGVRVNLTKNQRIIIDALVRAKGRLITRSALASAIGGDVFDNTVSVNIGRTRMKFRSINPRFDQLQVARGFGAYRWDFRRASTLSHH